MMRPIPRGINLRELEKLWRQFGGEISTVNRTGEARFVFPGVGRSPLYNNRRKDAPIKLVHFVNKTLAALPQLQKV